MGSPSRKSTASHETMAAIADEHFAFITRYLARLGVRAQDVEDVAQEVLAGAYRALPRYDPSRGSLRSWLIGIAAHQASNHFRRAHRRHERLQSLDELATVPDATPDSEQRVIARDRRCVLDQLLAEMPSERRFVFVAHEIEEMDMAEIARQLGIPLSTAWSRHRLAWADIQAAMRRWQARQRGRGLAIIPLGVGALVEEARAAYAAARARLARLWRRIVDACAPRTPAATGGAAWGAGAASALSTAAGVVATVAGAALTVALALGALRAAPSPLSDAHAMATDTHAMATDAHAMATPAAAVATPEAPDAARPPAAAGLSAGAVLPAGAGPSPGAGLSAEAALPEGAAPSAGAALSAATALSTGTTPLPGAAPAADAPQDGGKAAAAGAQASQADGAAPAAPRPATRRAVRAPSRSSSIAAQRGLASDDQEMAAERALLDSALAALSNGRYAEAKSRLAEHERRFPAGRLTAERNAAQRALRARTAR